MMKDQKNIYTKGNLKMTAKLSTELADAIYNEISNHINGKKSINLDSLKTYLKEIEVDKELLKNEQTVQTTQTTQKQKKEKKKKTDKGPDAPKRKENDFMRFNRAYRIVHKGEKKITELSKDAGKIWQSVKTDKDKVAELFEKYNVPPLAE